MTHFAHRIFVASLAGSLVALAGCGGSGGGSVSALGVNGAWTVMAGNDRDTVGDATALFADRSIITVGAYNGDATFGAGTATEQTIPASGGQGAYLARYTAAGSLVWANRIAGVGTIQPMGVVTHADGSFTVTGFFDGTATFGEGGPGTEILVTTGLEDVFVARYSGDGTLRWARQAAGPAGLEEATRIATRADGAVAITGLYTLAMTFGLGQLNVTPLLPSLSGLSGFVAAYAADGTFLWANSFEASGGAEGWGLAAFSDGGFALCGGFAGDVVFGAGEVNQTAFTGNGTSLDAFVARLDANGNLLWARAAGDAGTDFAYGVAVAPGDLVRVTGNFGGEALFGAEGPAPAAIAGFGDVADGFIAGYDGFGEFQWVKAFGTTGYDFATSVATFADGTFVVTGAIAGDGVFGQGEPGQTAVTTAGIDDHEVFVARFQPDGSLDWVAVTEGVHGSDAEATSVVSDADGSAVVTGYFTGTITFGSGFRLFGHAPAVLGGTGNHDAFVARYSPSGQF